jgi:hypothetical protein
VFEVAATSNERNGTELGDCNFLSDFRVEPAYQYDIFLEHPASVVNLATVVQKIGRTERGVKNYTMLTYDTHGTENKGFRKDEKLAREGKK